MPVRSRTAASSTTYKVDAQGRRVQKTAGGVRTDYFYSGSEIISEKQGSAWTDYIFFGGKRTARLDLPGAVVHYYFASHLGPATVVTNATGRKRTKTAR